MHADVSLVVSVYLSWVLDNDHEYIEGGSKTNFPSGRFMGDRISISTPETGFFYGKCGFFFGKSHFFPRKIRYFSRNISLFLREIFLIIIRFFSRIILLLSSIILPVRFLSRLPQAGICPGPNSLAFYPGFPKLAFVVVPIEIRSPQSFQVKILLFPMAELKTNGENSRERSQPMGLHEHVPATAQLG